MVERALEPKDRVILIFGPSQYGKSSFINTLLEYNNCRRRAEVGRGDGESVTLKVKTYEIGSILNMFPEDRIGLDTLKIIDVPGLYDSNLRISKKEIFEYIKFALLSSNLKKIDAILLFESMTNDSRKILLTFAKAVEYFGEALKESTIVLSTKWDDVLPKYKEKLECKLNEMIQKLDVDHMKWQNNYTENAISQEEMNAQISELGIRILRLSPYQVGEMDQLIERRNALAVKIREGYHDRYATQDIEVPVDVPEIYHESQEVSSMEWVPLTQSEIEAKAKNFFDCQQKNTGKIWVKTGTKEVKKTKSKPTIVNDPPFYKTHVFSIRELITPAPRLAMTTVKTNKQVDVIEEQDAPDNRIPLNTIKLMFQNEMKPVSIKKTIQIQKVRIKSEIRKISANHEKHEFSFYQGLATKQIKEEMKKLIIL